MTTTDRARRPRRRVRYRTLPIWAVRITEVIHEGGKRRAQVVTKTGKPRTIELR